MFIADGTYRFERGSGSNDFGDEVDTPIRVIERVPGVVSERNRLRSSDAGVTSVVRVTTGRFRPGLDVRQGDRVVNEQTEDTYTIDDVPHLSKMPGVVADTVVEMKRVAP